MKWLIIEAAGEHDGSDQHAANSHLTIGLAAKYALTRIGQEVDLWGHGYRDFANTPHFNDYDCILFVADYEFAWLPDVSPIRGPLKIQLLVDLHIGDPTRYHSLLKEMDVALHASREPIPSYREMFPNQKHIWFPNSFSDLDYQGGPLPKREDVCFVASPRAGRAEFVNRLKQDIGMKCHFALGAEMMWKIREAKIHFNKSLGYDTNARCFETIALGTCLCTNYQEELVDLGFVDKKNCLLYRSYEECVSKIEWALETGAWESLGAAGLELSKEHSYTKRFVQLLESMS